MVEQEAKRASSQKGDEMESLGVIGERVFGDDDHVRPLDAHAIATQPSLDDELEALREAANEHYAVHRRSNEQLYTDLAKVLCWYIKASPDEIYLATKFKERGIQYRQSGNRPNFNPLIRLVWNFESIGPTERVTISQWSKALQAMHERHSGNPHAFQHNPEGKLVEFIQSQGGVSGLAEGTKLAAEADVDDPAFPPSTTPTRSKTIQDDPRPDEIGRYACERVKASAGIGTATTSEPVRIGADGLCVLLGRPDVSGSVALLGSSNDPSHIEAVAAFIASREMTRVSFSLRALAETIATQAFPSHALPSKPEQRSKWYREKFADKSDLYENDLGGWDSDERGRRLTTSKRLLLRGGNREALFSSSLTGVSPTTRCLLAEPLIGEEDTVFLRASDRQQIEQWRESGELVLLRAETEDRLALASEAETATYKLVVKSPIANTTKVLHFYDHNPAKVTHFQAEFRRDAFIPAWRAELDARWFADLRQRWGDPWFAGLGRYNQITRPHNAVLALSVRADALQVTFNRHPDASASETFAFPKPIPDFTSAEQTTYLSKDVAPILFNLADAPANGIVMMEGNKHAIVFTYETAIGQIEIAVPTFNEEDQQRDGTLFYAADRADGRESDANV
jgi:hypothetical protein